MELTKKEQSKNELFVIKDHRILPDPIYSYNEEHSLVPIIIDNGSFRCRVGWATDEKPKLIFRNCYARIRKDRTKKNNIKETEVSVANDIANIEAVRFQLRSQFDENIVTQFEAQELIFDYIFTHLGISTPTINHPIIITEAFFNPHYSRQRMAELLFHCYGVPKVSFCVDGLLSYHANTKEEDGVLINIGYVATHVVPILEGRVDSRNCRRLRIGGQHLLRFLWRALQLKQPQLMNSITISRTETIFYEHCKVSEDFHAEMDKWANSEYYSANVTVVQLPFSPQPDVTSLTPEQLKERKREAAKRLSDINAKRRDFKLEEYRQELSRLEELEKAIAEFSPEEPEYQQALEEAEVNSLEELRAAVLSIGQRIQKTEMKIAQAAANPNKCGKNEESKTTKASFIYLPDEASNREQYLEGLKSQWKDIQDRKSVRKNLRQEMAKRRTLASQQRMRIISQLAKKEKKTDDFGIRDEDWNVYKAISKEGGGSDSEEDDEKLQELEAVLKHHCPQFMGINDSAWDKPASVAENYQLILGAEKICTGEILFQPSICGNDQVGIAAMLGHVLSLYSPQIQSRLVNNVWITGGSSKLVGLQARMERELCSIRPFKTNFRIQVADIDDNDSWNSARNEVNFLLNEGLTKAEFSESGTRTLKSHKLGNEIWSPICIEIATEPTPISKKMKQNP